MASAAVAAGYGPKVLRIGETIAGALFQPLAVVLLVALALEYIILKSADRTRLLQIELDRLRAKRQREVAAMRRTRDGLEALKQRIETSGPDALPLADEIARVIETLRPPEAQWLEGEAVKKQD